MNTKRTPISVRFWKNIEKSDGCWGWTGCLGKDGYGRISSGGKTSLGARPLLAHRVSWELNVGPIPDGLWVLHRCDNPPCVRPEHLFLGTHGDNMRDMVAKGRHAKIKPAAARPGETHSQALLTWEAVERIRAARAAGEPGASIARSHGVHPNTVYNVCKLRTWLPGTRPIPEHAL